jgi:hypothetical protein
LASLADGARSADAPFAAGKVDDPPVELQAAMPSITVIAPAAFNAVYIAFSFLLL